MPSPTSNRYLLIQIINLTFFFFKGVYDETCEVSICEDFKIEQHGSSKIDCDETSIKKNKTIMSKLKKKALRFSKVFSPGITY